MKIIDLVDSIEYTMSNCFGHQLHAALHAAAPEIVTVPLVDIEQTPRPDFVICRLKQRTVFREVERLQKWLHRTPIVIFDQDPWQAYMDDSPFKGTYELACSKLNVKTIAVTTELWADFLRTRGLPSKFVNMWVTPSYCDSGPSYEDRSITAGFIGSVHPYRKALFDRLDDLGTQVNVQAGNTLGYDRYLKALQNIRIFVHSEDGPLVVDGTTMNLKDGLWIKDVEAASQGCFSIRNLGAGYMSYLKDLPLDSSGHCLVRTYEDPDEVPAIIESIQKMDSIERQTLIETSVEYIRKVNMWHETAKILLFETSEVLKV